ncbi:alpha/beta hydrolase [Rugosibacter aromaticivorans]|uniref:Alpha/beta hydrolase n=1 Tax=Rugosibacter aromaticivorans TaxID=1565605 RepID=A0A0C5J989_9PROT|nr:alpha/beta hydrolase [Rugosibacter aromaticivorans]AJP48308.1 alpha/beta hydrolase [Rugosibacter aromaticivorans]TBR15134.1 MAG: alpha/beta hydrolase [Rugosibacter sp.]
MREGQVNCLSTAGFHHMAYVEWGDAHNPRVLICVHGLTRNGRDFDFLAQALEADYRVICPDVVGRGKSDWLANKSLYVMPQYCADMVTLLARLNVETIDWLGTSMGGLIGMALAAQPGNPIRRLVLNDVGPVVSAVSLARIGDYLGTPPRFDSIEEAEAYVRKVSAPFGPLTDTQWRHLTVHAVREAKDGKIEFVYDPGIAQAYRQGQQLSGGKDVELWPLFDAITCPTLLLRGEQSDLLTPQTAQAMTQRGPHAQLIEIPGVGHAPVLMDDAQIAPVRDFLLR